MVNKRRNSLALIFIVVAVSDSYAIAGALSATASVVMALATPHWSRVADRIGQSAMLIRVIPIKVCALCAFTVLVLNETPVWIWFVSIFIAEAFSVNTGGLVRRRWLHLLSPDKTTTAEDEQDRHIVNTAYSFETPCRVLTAAESYEPIRSSAVNVSASHALSTTRWL